MVDCDPIVGQGGGQDANNVQAYPPSNLHYPVDELMEMAEKIKHVQDGEWVDQHGGTTLERK